MGLLDDYKSVKEAKEVIKKLNERIEEMPEKFDKLISLLEEQNKILNNILKEIKKTK